MFDQQSILFAFVVQYASSELQFVHAQIKVICAKIEKLPLIWNTGWAVLQNYVFALNDEIIRISWKQFCGFPGVYVPKLMYVENLSVVISF